MGLILMKPRFWYVIGIFPLFLPFTHVFEGASHVFQFMGEDYLVSVKNSVTSVVKYNSTNQHGQGTRIAW
jgi:hypothetical protein